MIKRSEYVLMQPTMIGGGDFWNTNKLISTVFRDQDVEAMQKPSISTGLWADVRVLTSRGWITRRYFS